jgi:hypothetical protein
MTFLVLARQALGIAQAVGFYLLVVTGMPLLAIVVMSFVGYVPYSDRPGPGWYGLRLAISARELKFFVDWWSVTAVAALPAAVVLYVLRAVLHVVRTPRWALAIVCGFISAFIAAYLFLAAGWYIALSSVVVAMAALAGFIYGALLLPRLPIAVLSSSGNASTWRVAVWGAAPIFVIALTGLAIVTPRAQPEQASAFVVMGCALDHTRLADERGGLTAEETEQLRRLGVGGSPAVVAIITPWTAHAGGPGSIQQLPSGQPQRPGEARRTVIVVPELADLPVEVPVSFSAAGLYVKLHTGWTTIPTIAGATKMVRVAPIHNAPGNITVRLESVSMGSSYRYCR